MPLTLGHKLDANTLALWRMDEASGGAVDAVGTFPLSQVGSVGAATGKIGGARNGFGTSNLLSNLAADPTMMTATTGSWTLEAWVWIEPTIGLGALRTLWSLGPNGIGINGGEQFYYDAYWGVANTEILTTTGSFTIPKGSWSHFAVRKTVTGGGTTMTVDLFVNGVAVTTSAGLHNTDSLVSNPNKLGVGANWALGNAWAGILDEIRISKVARTDAEIADSYWRGLIDVSPGPTQAPFRQSRTPYQDAHRALSPTALLQPNGAAFEAGQGSVKDAFFDRCLQAVKARYPNLAPSDALAIIGADRLTPRGPGESDSAYAARLLNAWNVWPWAGTAYGLLQAFWSTGYKNVVLAQVRGGKQFTLDNGATNVHQWSQMMSNSAWATTNAAITQNSGVAPDGTTTAALFNEGTVATVQHFLIGTTVPSGTAGDVRCYSFFFKAGNLPNIFLQPNGNSDNVKINLGTGAIDGTGGASIIGSGIQTVGGGWIRAWCAVKLAGGNSGCYIASCGDAAYNSVYTGTSRTFSVWGAQCELGVTSPGPYMATYATTKPIALGAGSLLISTMASGIWETDVLSSLSPPNQSFWSQFDVVFPLPLMPPSWTWSAGIPSSSSAEANFIRALIQAWKPAHATCYRIVIVQQGNVWGYPADRLWGASNGTWGGANTVWTP